MKYIFYITLSIIVLSCTAAFKNTKKINILVYSQTKGFRHKSIEVGVEALKKLGEKNGYQIVHSENPADFNDENLKKFKVLLFLNPTGKDLFNDEQKAAFQKFMRKGGGFVDVHAATDCNYDWPWYGKLVGGYFESHPEIQEAELNILDDTHPSTKGLPKIWLHTDEWYNFKNFNEDVKVLVTVNEKSYKGGKMPDFHPISWNHTYDGGKVFYTALGHTEEDYKNELFLKHLNGGIQSVLK